MNDFDFEELDKAVSELATKNPDEHGEPVSVPALSRPAPTPAPRSTEEGRPVPPRQSLSVESDTTRSADIAAQPTHHGARLNDTRPRSRGSFMDIMPPTSRKMGARVGISIQPLSSPEDVTPDEQKPPETSPAHVPEQQEPARQSDRPDPVQQPRFGVEEAPEPPETPKSPEEEVKAASEVAWPDPLDFHGDDDEKAPAKDEKFLEPSDAQSPFLAEAKVEKRPLGAFSSFRPQPEQKPVDEPEPQPVEDELTPEADGTFTEPEAPAEPPEKPPTALEAHDAEPEKPGRPDMHSAAMMSIPKQYHTEAKSTDKTVRPIFDTKEYHPPLLDATAPEHHGGSMWSKLFIALVVLVLLGVAGYFAYIYVMQH